MKKKTKLIILVLLVSTWIGCSKNTETKSKIEEIEVNNKPYPLELTKEKEVYLDIVIKGWPIFSKTDSPHNIFLRFTNEDKNCEIWKFDTDLKFEKKFIIRRGRGPGEGIWPTIIGGDDENITVYGGIDGRVMIFDPDFKLKRMFKIKSLGNFIFRGFSYSPRHKKFLMGTLLPKGTRIDWIFDFNIYIRHINENSASDKKIFFKTTKYRLLSEKDKHVMDTPLHYGLINDHIYILDFNEYRFIKMDLEGNILKQVKVKFEVKKFPEKLRQKWIKDYGYSRTGIKKYLFPEFLNPVCFIMHVGNGIAVGRREDYSAEEREYIEADYFDFNLNFLGKIKLPYFRKWNEPIFDGRRADHLFYTKNGKLFYIEEKEDGEFWLTRWKIKTNH